MYLPHLREYGDAIIQLLKLDNMEDFSYEDLSGTIDMIYEAALGPGGWKPVLRHISARLGGVVANLEFSNRSSGVVSVEDPIQLDASLLALYTERIHALNPRVDLARNSKLGQIVWDGDILQSGRSSTEFDDWLSKTPGRYFAGTRILSTSNEVGFFCLHFSASKGMADERTRRILAALAPHFERATSVSRSLGRASDIEDLLEAGSLCGSAAYAFLDVDGRIAECSAQFEALVSSRNCLAIVDRRLIVRQRRTQTLLAEAIAAALQPTIEAKNPRHIPVDTPEGLRGIAIRLMPLSRASNLFSAVRPRAIMTMVDLDAETRSDGRSLRELYGLTSRESQIATAIAAGASVSELAVIAGISQYTVRQHLASTFRKTGTAGQNDLVRLVSRIG